MQTETIESTAGRIAADLAARGVAPDQRVTVTLEAALTDAEKLSSLKNLVKERLDGVSAGNVLNADSFFARLKAKLLVS